MNAHLNNTYRGPTPEELHLAIRRAHLERARAVREMLAAAWARVRNATGRRVDRPALNACTYH